jgi:hypothetical protein
MINVKQGWLLNVLGGRVAPGALRHGSRRKLTGRKPTDASLPSAISRYAAHGLRRLGSLGCPRRTKCGPPAPTLAANGR